MISSSIMYKTAAHTHLAGGLFLLRWTWIRRH